MLDQKDIEILEKLFTQSENNILQKVDGRIRKHDTQRT